MKFGKHVFMSHNEVLRDGKMVRDKIKLDDVMLPRALQGNARKPALLDPALVRPDELPLLERAVPG